MFDSFMPKEKKVDENLKEFGPIVHSEESEGEIPE